MQEGSPYNKILFFEKSFGGIFKAKYVCFRQISMEINIILNNFVTLLLR